MSHISSTVCDAPNCNQVKGSTNHWWRVRKSVGGQFVVSPFSDPEAGTDLHICSSNCLHKMMETWIEGFMPKVEVGFDHKADSERVKKMIEEDERLNRYYNSPA